jgi:hypothetical protein
VSDDFFSNAKQHELDLLKKLSKCPPLEIVGLVDAMGVSGNKLGKDNLWTASFTLDAWKPVGGKVTTTPLRIIRKASDAELDELRNKIAPDKVVLVRAQVLQSSAKSDGLLVDVLVNVGIDHELSALAQKLQQLVTISDPEFGEFKFDRALNWFEGRALWQSNQIKLNLSMDECDDHQELLNAARALWQTDWSERILNFAAGELLELKNSSWLEDSEKPVTLEQFKRCMALETVTVYPGGIFSFSYDDGELFWGHVIQVSVSLTEGPTSADIAG